MSSGGPAGDAEDLARARSGPRAGESSGAREQVRSEAAYELHCRATADSAVGDHPGFVPDAYLDGLGCGSGVMVAELCSAGVWERVEEVDGIATVLLSQSKVTWEPTGT